MEAPHPRGAEGAAGKVDYGRAAVGPMDEGQEGPGWRAVFRWNKWHEGRAPSDNHPQ